MGGPGSGRRSKLTKLTAPQLELLPDIRDQWLRIGLATGPADRAAAEEGARRAYAAAGLNPPVLTIWLRSPLEGAVGAAMLKKIGPRDQVWDQVWDQVGDQVRDQVRAQVRAQDTRDELGWSRIVYGQHEAGWLSYFDAMGHLGIDVSRLDGLMAVARSASWWWPKQSVVVLTERPITLSRDDAGFLHREDGPAIAYPDGFGVWAWHGVRVPRWVIEEPETLSADHVRQEHNAEIRRVMVERIQPDRYLAEVGARELHRDDWGTLWAAPVPGDEPLVLVQVTNSSPEPDGSFKDYWLRVPPTIRTARDAVAWTFGHDAATYEPVVQT